MICHRFLFILNHEAMVFWNIYLRRNKFDNEAGNYDEIAEELFVRGYSWGFCR